MKKISNIIILFFSLFLNLNFISIKKSNAGNENNENYIKQKRKFTKEEDEKLNSLVEKFGTKNWKIISYYMPNRNTRQCRERYSNYLQKDIKNEPWTIEEDNLLKKKYEEYGKKFNILRLFFPERSYINIKNRLANNLRKKSKKKKNSKKTVIKQKKYKNKSNETDKNNENFNNDFNYYWDDLDYYSILEQTI